jgi:ferredoxin
VRKIVFEGASPRSFQVPDFETPSLDSLGLLPDMFGWFTRRFLVSRPLQQEETCIGCGQCSQICPADALQIDGRRAEFDYDRCIRCYCCQEVCPQDAIGFHKGLLVRLMGRLNR